MEIEGFGTIPNLGLPIDTFEVAIVGCGVLKALLADEFDGNPGPEGRARRTNLLAVPASPLLESAD